MSSFLGVDPRAMVGTVGGMLAGLGTHYAFGAIGQRLAPGNTTLFVAGGWLVGIAAAVGIAQKFADGDPRPALFAGGFVYLATLQALFTAPHPLWAMAVGGLGVPAIAVFVSRLIWKLEDEA